MSLSPVVDFFSIESSPINLLLKSHVKQTPLFALAWLASCERACMCAHTKYGGEEKSLFSHVERGADV